MLFQREINWNDYPARFKRGVYVQRRKVFRKFTVEEIDKLPDRHDARSNPDLVIERTEIRELAMPTFSQIVNKVGVVFRGEDPQRVSEE